MSVGNPPKQEIYIHERPQCDFWRTSSNSCSLVKPFGKPTDPILPFLFRQEFLLPKKFLWEISLCACPLRLWAYCCWRYGEDVLEATSVAAPSVRAKEKMNHFLKKEEGEMWRGKWSRPTRHFFLQKCDLLASLGNFFISNPEPPCHHYTRNRLRLRFGRTSQSKQSTTFCGFPNNFFPRGGTFCGKPSEAGIPASTVI